MSEINHDNDKKIHDKMHNYFADMLKYMPEQGIDAFSKISSMRAYGYRPSIDLIQTYNYYITDYNKKVD